MACASKEFTKTAQEKQQGVFKHLVVYVLSLLVVLYCVYAIYMNAQIYFSPSCLLAVGVLSMILAFRDENLDPHKSNNYEKWLLLYGAIFIIMISMLMDFETREVSSAAVFLCLSSLFSYLCGRKMFIRLILPLAVIMIVIPYFEQIYYWTGFPIRLICTKMTVFFLTIFGMQISSDATVITVGIRQVAITEACSGLVLLETLSWIGWFIVLFIYKEAWKRILHYLFIFPLVLVVNTLRLIVLAVLFDFYGDVVIRSPIHIWIGYIMVLVAAIIFYFARGLFEEHSK